MPTAYTSALCKTASLTTTKWDRATGLNWHSSISSTAHTFSATPTPCSMAPEHSNSLLTTLPPQQAALWHLAEHRHERPNQSGQDFPGEFSPKRLDGRRICVPLLRQP